MVISVVTVYAVPVTALIFFGVFARYAYVKMFIKQRIILNMKALGQVLNESI
jgi:hypothetical protein